MSEISIKGKNLNLPVFAVDGRDVYVVGKFIRIARIKGEFFGEDLSDPEDFIRTLYKINCKADILSFWQGLPPKTSRLPYYMEWDNIAAIPITTYEYWFKEQVNRMVRKNIRKSVEKGVTVRKDILSDDLLKGIHKIFNETPIRQGKTFWHYGKDIETIKREMARDLDRSEFIGAYLKDNLIGFAKIIYCKNVAHFAQILSEIKHRDKQPTTALINAAVKICIDNNIQYLSYGSYVYGNKGDDPLTEFKKHIGFLKIELPRYYVPFNRIGSLAIKMKLHRDFINILPERIVRIYLNKIRFYCHSLNNKIWI